MVAPTSRSCSTPYAPGASVLDLGSGPGRIANPLARAGHDVVAVDDSQAMLDHVEGATTVLADLWTLDLGSDVRRRARA